MAKETEGRPVAASDEDGLRDRNPAGRPLTATLKGTTANRSESIMSRQPVPLPHWRDLVLLLASLFLLHFLPAHSLAETIDLGKTAQRRCPYRFVLEKKFPLPTYEHVLVTDLDQNNVSELLYYPYAEYFLAHGPSRNLHYMLRGPDTRIIQEEPILDNAFPNGVRELDVLDTPGNELVITYRRGNQLRCRIWNYQTLLRRDFAIYTRTSPDSSWDTRSVPVATVDANLDGRKEILIYLRTGYAHMPRGWVLLDPNSGKVVQKALFGGLPSKPGRREGYVARDFDSDGHIELVLGTDAPENHFELNGVSDLWSYVLVYDLVTGQRELSRIMGPYYGSTVILGQGPTPDTWIAVYHGVGGKAEESASRLSLFRWKSAVPEKEFPITSRFRAETLADYDGDGTDDIYCVLMDTREIWVLSSRLELLHKVRLKNLPPNAPPGGWFKTASVDVDLDGRKDLLVDLGGSLFFFNSRLQLLGAVPGTRHVFRGVFRRGAGKAPLVVAEDPINVDTRNVYWWRLEPTPFLVRYGPSPRTVYGFLAALFVAGVVYGISSFRRLRRSDRLFGTSLETLGCQVISLGPQGKVEFSRGKQLVPVKKGLRLGSVLQGEEFQPLLAAVNEWERAARLTTTRLEINSPSVRGRLRIDFQVMPNGERLTLIVCPARDLNGPSSRHLEWLTSHLNRQVERSFDAIKKELLGSSGGLPSANAGPATGSNRALQEFEELQASLRRLLKLVDASRATPRLLDLNALLGNWGSRQQNNRSAGIRLVVESTQALPPVVADPERLEGILDLLLKQALDSAPRGGVVRLSTRVEYAYQRAGDAAPRDYVVLEFKYSSRDAPSEASATSRNGRSASGAHVVDPLLLAVQQAVQQGNGHLEVTSAPGIGTIVTLYLPAKNGEPV